MRLKVVSCLLLSVLCANMFMNNAYAVYSGWDSCFNKSSKDEPIVLSLHDAVRSRNFDLVRSLISTGTFDLNAKDGEGNTPLHVAVDTGCLEIAKFLIDSNARLDIKNNFERTILHLAASKGFTSLVVYLVRSGGLNVNDQDVYGMTPLHFSVINGDLESVQFLVKNGAEVGLKDRLMGLIPIMWAASGTSVNFDIVKCLIDAGSSRYVTMLDRINLSQSGVSKVVVDLIDQGRVATRGRDEDESGCEPNDEINYERPKKIVRTR